MAREIVVGVDGSPPATAAVEWAALDARRRGRNLRLVHVCEEWPHQHTGKTGDTKYCSEILEVAADRARALTEGVKILSLIHI